MRRDILYKITHRVQGHLIRNHNFEALLQFQDDIHHIYGIKPELFAKISGNPKPGSLDLFGLADYFNYLFGDGGGIGCHHICKNKNPILRQPTEALTGICLGPAIKMDTSIVMTGKPSDTPTREGITSNKIHP
jgi:hypothetical protein